MHSQCSDGTHAPDTLMETMAAHGVRVVALTDHDTTAGWTAACEAAAAHGLQILPGVELSVTVDEDEVHLLGYGFDPDDAALHQHLQRFMEAREDRVRAMVERLQANDIAITLDDVHAEADGAQALGRPHVAAALKARGAVPTINDAFRRYIGNGEVAFVPKPPAPAHEVIALLHGANGIGVLAHPGHWTTAERIRRLVDAGLDGIEVVHPVHEPYLQAYYADVAERYGLLQTGGSDFHGRGDADRVGRFGLRRAAWERLRNALT